MWPLLLFSILSVSFIIERIIFWNKININLKLRSDFEINQFTDITYLKSLKKKDINNNPYKKLLFKIKDFDLSSQRNLSIALSISIELGIIVYGFFSIIQSSRTNLSSTKFFNCK